MARTATIETKKVFDPLAAPEAQPVLRLIESVKAGKKTVENCYFCAKSIQIESFENVSFKLSCPCGKSNGFLNGI